MILNSQDRAIAIDTETTYTDLSFERKCLGIAVSTGEANYYIPVGHNDWLIKSENLMVPRDFFSQIKAPIIMHNAKFDLQVLRKLGIEVPVGQLYDTMLMSHYINEYPPHALDALAKEYLGIGKEKDLQAAMKKEWDNMPAVAMAKYAGQDTAITRDLFYVLWSAFKIFDDLWSGWDRDFMLLLTQVEERGIRIDRQKCQHLSELCGNRMAEIVAELGFDPAKPSKLHPKLFDSPPLGLGLKPSSYTPKGRPKVDDSYLQSVGHPLTALVLEYRGLVKQKSSYFDAYLGLTTRDYPRLHPNFKIHGTVTGRLSCADPNLQQVPRKSKVKEVFLPEEGKQLWEVDYSNLEMRLAAVYAKNPTLLETFRSNGDVHQQVANDLRVDRQKAKTVNFLIIYGGGKRVLAQQLGIKESEAAKILSSYRETYPEIFDCMDRATATAQNEGYVKYWSGRHRHFKWPSEAHKAFNSVVQGGGFDIVKRGMLQLHNAGFDIRNQVHDSVWINVDKEAEVKEAEHLMSEWTEELFGLRFTVDSKRLN